MKTIVDVLFDSMVTTNQISQDKEIYELVMSYLHDKISLEKYAYEMMELALKRGCKVYGLTHEGANDIKYFDKNTNTVNHQKLNDTTIENAMEIPELEAIFANANPDEYFQHVLSMAIHQYYTIEKIKKALFIYS